MQPATPPFLALRPPPIRFSLGLTRQTQAATQTTLLELTTLFFVALLI
jgi:hypothetical protein